MILQEISTKTLFEGMSESSKVWIYQANRTLSQEEREHIQEKSIRFVNGWASHGSKLKADAKVLYNHFLVFCVDEKEHEASGCSIDKSVHFVKELQSSFNIDFFNRTLITYLDSSGNIQLVSLGKLKEKIASQEITKESLIFNNLIENLHSFREHWIDAAGDTWLSKYF